MRLITVRNAGHAVLYAEDVIINSIDPMVMVSVGGSAESELRIIDPRKI